MRPPRILLAEDNPGDIFLLQAAFEAVDWEPSMEVITDGRATVERLEAPGADLPDLLILDLNLPALGGREILARLPARPDLGAIPAVILSGSEFERRALAASGFPEERYLLKANDFDGFIELARRIRHLWERAAT